MNNVYKKRLITKATPGSEEEGRTKVTRLSLR